MNVRQYASGIFHLLYRTMPSLMLQDVILLSDKTL